MISEANFPKLIIAVDGILFETPIGTLRLRASDEGLTRLDLPNKHDASSRTSSKRTKVSNKHLLKAMEELDRYFKGDLRRFSVKLDFRGTAFQRSVWKELMKIPYGKTMAYGELAHRIGNPNAQRAVGMANNRNPIAIIAPCHRVIGKDGSMTGYGGGLWRKEWLLRHEGLGI